MKNSLKNKVAIATISALTIGTLSFAGPALGAYDSMPDGFYTTDPTFIPSVTMPEDIYGADGVSGGDDDHWAVDAIENMVSIKAVSGYPDKKFYPDKPVTRAELASAMANAMYLPKGEAIELLDVSESHWASGTISTALPYLAAFQDGSFRPEAPITREEVAVAIVKAAGLDGKKVDPNIIDVIFKDPKTVSPDLKKLVAVAVDQKLLKGIIETDDSGVPVVDGAMYIKAKDLVTRGEMCYLLDAARAKVGLGQQIVGGE